MPDSHAPNILIQLAERAVTPESKFLNFPQVIIMGRFSNQTLYASESSERLIKIQFAGPRSSSLAFTGARVGLEKLHFENISIDTDAAGPNATI